MALLASLSDTPIGIPLNEVYVRIVVVNASTDYASLAVAHYANQEARENSAMEILMKNFNVQSSELEPGENFINIAYKWLKTQTD